MELVAWRSAEGQRVVSSESEEEGRVGGGRLGWGGGESSSGVGAGEGEVRVTSETMTMCGVGGGGGGGGGRGVDRGVKRWGQHGPGFGASPIRSPRSPYRAPVLWSEMAESVLESEWGQLGNRGDGGGSGENCCHAWGGDS